MNKTEIILQDSLKKAGEFIIQKVRDQLTESWMTQGRMGYASQTDIYNNVKYTVQDNSLTITFPSYTIYVNNGRRNFQGKRPLVSYKNIKYTKKDIPAIMKHRPPASAISKWMVRRSIPVDPQALFGIRFMVSLRGVPKIPILSIPIQQMNVIKQMLEESGAFAAASKIEDTLKKYSPTIKVQRTNFGSPKTIKKP